MLFIISFRAIRYDSFVDNSIFALECRHTLISKVAVKIEIFYKVKIIVKKIAAKFDINRSNEIYVIVMYSTY